MSISLQEMIDAGVHFGHQTKFWNPKMKQYIFGIRNKIHIINLDKTIVLFNDALKFADQVIKNKAAVLFVGTRSQSGEIIAEEAVRSGMPYVDHRWLGGMLTNFETVKKSIKKLEVKSVLLEKAEENNLSKKEVLDLTREINKLKSSIGGIVDMKQLPGALFIIDTGCHDIAIKEAKKLGIPVIGVVDSNNDPSVVDYVIPGNDDSAKAIRLYAQAFADVIIKAKESVVTNIIQAKVEMVNEDNQAKHKTVRKVKQAEEDVAEVEAIAIVSEENIENKVTASASVATTEEKPVKKVKAAAKKEKEAAVAEEKPAKKAKDTAPESEDENTEAKAENVKSETTDEA